MKHLTPPEHNNKRRFIKDVIWGSIEYFPWEAELLQHPLVNRLHRIVQNSTAYLVYPGLNYSRFVHSIGTMHVATQTFTNLVINSAPHDELSEDCDRIGVFFPNTSQISNYKKLIVERTRCPDEKYALLLGVIRIAALLHDIGHLPYSHIFEFALRTFLQKDLDELDHPSKELKKCQELLRDIFKYEKKGEETTIATIHEEVGKHIIQLMLGEDPNGQKSYTPFLKGAKALLIDQKLPLSKTLLDATVDVDRIDFVLRNGLFAGIFFQRPTNLDRLLAFYLIDESVDANGKKAIITKPSPLRAASEIENLIWLRFTSYEYIIAHHKVHLFDELLERLLLFGIFVW